MTKTLNTVLGKVNGKDVVFAFPVMSEEDLNRPMKKCAADPEVDPEVLRQHEQIYRAIEMFLVEQGLDAILYGTAGKEFDDEPTFQPAITVMVGCEKYDVTLDGYDIIVKKQSQSVQYRNKNRIWGTPLQEPNSIERLEEFLRTL